MTYPLQFQLYIGPAWHRSDSPYFFDWSTLPGEAAINLDYETTLSATLANGAASASVVSSSAFPSRGGVWIGPNGSGQGWEYADYASKGTGNLGGLVREPAADRDHNGVHSAGAIVRPWWKVRGDDGTLRVDMQLDGQLVASDWQFQVSGIAAPQAALAPYHVCVVQYRLASTGTLVDMFIGFLEAATMQDDAKRLRRWSARIGSSAGLMRRIQVDGIRIGEYDLALAGSAQSSTPLAAAHKERWSGDFIAANPNFDAGSIVDEDEDSIWINDRLVGTDEDPHNFDGFSQLYINPPPSVNAGTRWLEFIYHQTASVVLAAWDVDSSYENLLDIPAYDLTPGQRVIVAESITVFQRENPTSEAAFIYDVSESDNPGWFNAFRLSGGAVAFRFFDNYSKGVYWGSVTEATTGWNTGWVGPTLTPPDFDQTMRYKMLDQSYTNYRDRWENSMRQSPGYPIEPNQGGWQAFVALELPGMGLILHDDITASVPGVGSKLFIDGQNGPCTDGLPVAGTIIVGDERIDFNSKTADGVIVGARGGGGSTAASHLSGDAVFVLQFQGGRTYVCDAFVLDAVRWEREGGLVPADFIWRISALPARMPSEDNHEDDYDTVNVITGNNALFSEQTYGNVRARTVVLEFNRMNQSPNRPRINRLKAIVDPSFFNQSNWLHAGETVEQLIGRVASNAGMPSGAFIITDGGKTPSGFMTGLELAWSVMESAAELGGSTINISRSSKIAIAPDTFWATSVGGLSPFKTWTRTNATSVEWVRMGGGAASQIKITWETPDGNDGGIATYPTTPTELGQIQEIGKLYFASKTEADLAARKRYYMSRFPYELMITLSQGDMTVVPRQVHRVQWQFRDDSPQIDRMILVRQVQHTVGQLMLSTVLHGIVVDQEWEQ